MKTLFLSFICCISASVCAAQAAFFDPTFGSGGKTIVPLGTTENGSFEAVVLQPDGKIIVAGIMAGQAVVARFKENGTPDSSFAVNGYYISPSWGKPFNDVILQPDGKIVAAGSFMTALANDDYMVLRLSATGIPDPSFGTGGVAIIDFSGSNDHCYSVAQQVDGKLVLAGQAQSVKIGLARLLGNGIPDTSFGTNGKVLSGYDWAYYVDIAPDGKIVIGGQSSAANHYALTAMRFLTDGTADTTFNHTGTVYTQAGDLDGNSGRAIKVLLDGKVLLAGTGDFGAESSNFVTVRYNADGTLDNTFGSDGIANVDFDGHHDALCGLYVATDGRLLLAGSTVTGTDKREVAVALLHENGIIDNGSGNNGRIVIPIRENSDYGLSIAMQTDDKIIVAGSSYKSSMSGSYCDPVILRLLPYVSEVFDIVKTKEDKILFPNPAAGILYLDESKASKLRKMCVSDVAGKRVMQISQPMESSIEIGCLPTGIYIFKLTDEDDCATFQKILITN